MAVEIISAKADLPSINMLVYADSGTGKTVFGTSGAAGRVLAIAPEDTGLASGINLGYEFDKITVKNWDDFVEAYEYCYDFQDDLKKKYDWILIDSATEMQGMCLRGILANNKEERIRKEQDVDVPQIQDYQKLYILVEKMVLAFNDLPINILYTALVRNVEDPSGEEFLMPMLGSNKPTDYRIAMKIAAHMTSYGYLKVEVVEKPAPTENDPKRTKKVKQRVIYFEDTGTYRGKDRTTKLSPKIELPPKNALDFVTKVARGEIDKTGKPVEKTVKRTPAKKAAGVRAGTAKMQSARDEVVVKPQTEMPNPIAHQENESQNGDVDSIDLQSVEA